MRDFRLVLRWRIIIGISILEIQERKTDLKSPRDIIWYDSLHAGLCSYNVIKQRIGIKKSRRRHTVLCVHWDVVNGGQHLEIVPKNPGDARYRISIIRTTDSMRKIARYIITAHKCQSIEIYHGLSDSKCDMKTEKKQFQIRTGQLQIWFLISVHQNMKD